MSDGIYKAICNIMGDISAIGKNQKNQAQRFNFRGIDDVYNSIHPLFKKHGVFTYCSSIKAISRDEITSKGGGKGWQIINEYTFKFCAGDGSSFDVLAHGEAMDYGDKSSNKAAAIAHKYAITQTFCIPTQDMQDPDADSPTAAASKPAKPKSVTPSKVYKGEQKQKEGLADLFDTICIEDALHKKIIHLAMIEWKTPYNAELVNVVTKAHKMLQAGEPLPQVPF
jgi:hypothetical protein